MWMRTPGGDASEDGAFVLGDAHRTPVRYDLDNLVARGLCSIITIRTKGVNILLFVFDYTSKARGRAHTPAVEGTSTRFVRRTIVAGLIRIIETDKD